MNERDIPEIKEIMEEWIKEVEQLEPLKINGNVLDNSLNSKRLELERKYRKRIEEALKNLNDPPKTVHRSTYKNHY